MSHVDSGPLAAYNSLTDKNLTGYFTNTRMRRHLRKSGLITKRGEIVSENTYRLTMARKEHKKHVKNMLAQAIVHKTLDLERSRQSEIRKKLEEIAKIELVRRVRSDRQRHLEDAILPYLAPKSAKVRTKSSKRRTSSHSPTRKAYGRQARAEVKESNGKISAVQERASREKKRENYVLPLVSPRGGSRPSSSSTYSDMKSKGRYRPVRPKSTPSRRKRRPISALSSNYDDENETVVYLDDEGRPISPSHVDESEMKYSSKDPIDTRHLYSLDTTALRKYAMLMAQVEQGKDGVASPYLVPQVPIPPKSPHHGGTPRSAHRYRPSVEAARLHSPKRPTTADQAYLHPAASAKQFRGQQESMCEIFMIYHGQALSLAREQFDKRQDIVVEQQHCGGNTLIVFRDKMEPDTEFSFISYRHCGYPFALSIYIDGKIDCRISTCCEYRHAKGRRIAGKKGHFGIKAITGAKPCYKCQVEKGIRVKSAAQRPKLKRPPKQQEEVVVVETKQEPKQKELDNDGHVEQLQEEILVPVDHLEENKKYDDESEAADDYEDDDFEDSEPEEAYVYSGVYTSERGHEDGVDSDRRSQKEAENIIKIANKIVEESAIKESKENCQADERGSRSKKDLRKVTCDEYVDEESLSSCKSDEDYYEYKKRMMKKIKEQEIKKKAKKAKQAAANTTDETVTESGSRHRYQDDDNQESHADQEGRKKSSTSSAFGQAEPVNSKPAKRQNAGGRAAKHRKKGTADAKSSSDGNATADEVSDIESEMAASPRKAEAEKGDVEDKAFHSDDKGGQVEGSCFDEKVLNSDIKSIDNAYSEGVVKKQELNHKQTNKDIIILSPSVAHDRKYNGKMSDNCQDRRPHVVSKLDTELNDNDAHGINKSGSSAFHMDICPADSTSRGEGDFEMSVKSTELYEDLRGIANSEGKRNSQRKAIDRGKKSQLDEYPIELNIAKPINDKENVSMENSKQQIVKFENKKQAATGTEISKKNEIIIHPMTKTGENKYLRKQEREQVELRIKSENETRNMHDENKRKGRYIADLSPKMKVIRGVVGDDGSESDGYGDETYSKILLRDGRASVSDTEQDSDARRKDYILSESDKKYKNQHVTFIENANEGTLDDKPNYRVIINIEHEQEKEKAQMERGRRKREREERRKKRLEDTRGTSHIHCMKQEDDEDDNEDNIFVEVSLPSKHKSPDVETETGSARESGNEQMKHQQSSYQQRGETNVYHHPFSEESPPPPTHYKDERIQAVPNLNLELYEKAEDDECSHLNEFADHTNEFPKDMCNGETWYEMSTIPDEVPDDSHVEIVGTKYVENESERYPRHYKAFKESPNVDNNVVKSTQGLVTILSSQDQIQAEAEKEMLHISVLSPNSKQKGNSHEIAYTDVGSENKESFLPDLDLENEPNKHVTLGSQLEIPHTSGIITSEPTSSPKGETEENRPKIRPSPRPSIDNVTADNLRNLWLGSGIIHTEDLSNDNKKAEEVLDDYSTTNIESCKDINNDPKKPVKMEDVAKHEKPQIGSNHVNNHEIEISGKSITLEDNKLSLKHSAEGEKTSDEEDKDISCNDSYSEDFSEIDEEENRKAKYGESKAGDLFHVAKVSDSQAVETNEKDLGLKGESPIFSPDQMTNNSVGQEFATQSDANTSKGDDVDGIDALIEVLENQLENSKKSRKDNDNSGDLKNSISPQKTLNTGAFSLAVDSYTNFESLPGGSDTKIERNSVKTDSSEDANFTTSIAEADTSSDSLDQQAKAYVNELLASISAVGFDDNRNQTPFTANDTNAREVRLGDHGEIAPKPTDKRIRELTRQACISNSNENSPDSSFHNQDLGLHGVEFDHDESNMNANDDGSLLSAQSHLATPKGFINFQPKEARGVDKTTGRVDIHDVSDEDNNDEDDDDNDWEERYSKLLTTNDEEDGRKTSLGQSKEVEEEREKEKSPSPRPLSPVPSPVEFKEENRPRRESVSSTSSSSSSSSSMSSREGGSSDDYSDSDVDKKEPEKKEENVVVAMQYDQQDSGKDEQALEIPIGSAEAGAIQDGGYEQTKAVETAVEEDEDVPVKVPPPIPVATMESRKPIEDVSRASSSSMSSSSPSSSSGSATIHDQGPNTINDPTVSVADEKSDQKEEVKESDNERDRPISREVVLPLTSVKGTVETPEPPSEKSKSNEKSSSDSSSSSDESNHDSSSDLDSDAEPQEPKKEEEQMKKDSIIETQAEVYIFEKRPSHGNIDETESDPEATHGGNDPDNVANDNVITVARTIDPVPMGMPKEGSVLSLLEANRNAVEIKGVTLNKTQVYEVAEFLEKAEKLNSVTLVNCGIDDDDIQKLMEALRASPSNPVMLNLSLNPLTEASVTHILQTVNVKNGIEAVLLQGTRLGDQGVNTLIDGILAQYDMNKDDPEMKEKGLHELDLSDCKFGDDGAIAISGLLKSDVDIDTITLSHNHAVSLDGWRYIGNTLRETNNLETLTLDHNFIGDEGIEAIASGLQENTTLTALDINDVGITDKGAKCIMDMLKKNTTILEIVMMENKISDSIAENIQKYISLNKASFSQ